jgi:hypothetical protein
VSSILKLIIVASVSLLKQIAPSKQNLPTYVNINPFLTLRRQQKHRLALKAGTNAHAFLPDVF